MRSAVVALVFSLTTGILHNSADAINLHDDEEGTKLDFLVESGGLYAFSNADFTPQNRDEVDWLEGYTELGFDWTISTGRTSRTYGSVSILGTITRGEGDPTGFSTGEEEHIDFENAYLGFETDIPTGVGDLTLDVSGGSQRFTLGNGFLISNDSINLGDGFGGARNRGGAFLLNPREAFRGTAVARIDTESPWYGKAFYLDSDTGVQGESDLAGGHIGYEPADLGRFGATYARVLDVRQRLNLVGNGPFRRDLNTLHGFGQVKPGRLPGSTISAGASYQWGTPEFRGVERNVDAYAWYARVQQALPVKTVPLRVSYQFTAFSGDDPGTSKIEGFDPLFRGVDVKSDWLFGIIAGFFTGPFNQNANIHRANVSAYPTDSLQLTAEFLHFSRRETVGNRSDDIGNEVDVYALWRPISGVTIAPAYAYLQTQDSLEAALGTNENVHYVSAAFITEF